jgi:hypothetical protein
MLNLKKSKMKKAIILFGAAAILLFAGCKKDPDTVSTVVEVSYPTINLKGPAYVHIPIGGSYVEEGATLIDDITGASSDISPTSSEVDNTTPGIYAVTFIASNANGFKTEVKRTVLVLDWTPPSTIDPGYDISGPYHRTNGIPVNLYKMASGLYIIDNFAGSTLVYPAYLITPDSSSIDIPAQNSFGGYPLECVNETFDGNAPITFSYICMASGFGTGVRTFIKD